MNYELLDHLLNPIIVVDDKFKIKYFNHICSVYFKLPPRKITKLEKIEELLISSQASIVEYLEKAKTEKTPIVTKEIEISLPENIEQAMTVILKMIPYNNDFIIHVWDFSIEKHLHEKYKKQILELRETHEQIMKSDKLAALGELVAGIGHEVSNPLTIIMDRVQDMEDNILFGHTDNLSDNLSDIGQGVQRISKIIANLQSMTRNQDNELQIVSIQEVVSNSIRFIKDLNILNQIKITTDINCDQWVLANEIKLEQVLINLVKNSIDALIDTHDPKIIISVYSDNSDQSVILEVSDNGEGVKKENEDKLFDMFYTSKEFGEGTGLGLSISQKIIESYQGVISYLDTKVGAKFQIALPSIALSTFSQTNDYLNGNKEVEDMKILIFDNNLERVNKLYKAFELKDFVIIVDDTNSNLEDLIDFYTIDLVIHFTPKKKNLEAKELCLAESFEFSEESILEMVKKYV